MTASFINGTKIAEEIKREVAAEVETLKGRGVQPGLAVVLVGDDAASSAYVNMKAKTCEQLGIYSRKLTVPSAVTTEQLLPQGEEAPCPQGGTHVLDGRRSLVARDVMEDAVAERDVQIASGPILAGRKESHPRLSVTAVGHINPLRHQHARIHHVNDRRPVVHTRHTDRLYGPARRSRRANLWRKCRCLGTQR